MSSKVKPWRKKDKKHFRPKGESKKKHYKFEIDPNPPRYEVVDGQYVRVR